MFRSILPGVMLYLLQNVENFMRDAQTTVAEDKPLADVDKGVANLNDGGAGQGE